MLTARNAVREAGVRYKRHQPELTLLYQIIETYYPEFLAYVEKHGKTLPTHIKKEFDAYLKCGRLEEGFFRVRCEDCHHERLVAFSCKKRGFCPSCGARRMAESAALLVDEVLPHEPIRQYIKCISGVRLKRKESARLILIKHYTIQPRSCAGFCLLIVCFWPKIASRWSFEQSTGLLAAVDPLCTQPL